MTIFHLLKNNIVIHIPLINNVISIFPKLDSTNKMADMKTFFPKYHRII